MRDTPIKEIQRDLQSEGIDVDAFIKRFEQKRQEITEEKSSPFILCIKRIKEWFHGLIQFFLRNRKPVFSLGFTLILAVFVVKVFYPPHQKITYRDQGMLVSQKIDELNETLMVLNQQEKYNEAIPIARQTIILLEHHAGKQHPDTAKAWNNLALLYKKTKDYKQAEQLYLRALDIQPNVLEEGHEDTLATLNNLGLLYEEMKDFEKAEERYKEIITIRENIWGMQHPKTIESRRNLEILYKVMENERHQ